MATISEAEYRQRIEALERLNITLAAEVDRLRCEYGEEVDEFNAGFAAAEQGLPDTAEPSHVKYDVWKCGYAWGRYPPLTAQVDRMRSVVEAAEARVQSLSNTNPDGLTDDEIVLATRVRLYRREVAALVQGERQ